MLEKELSVLSEEEKKQLYIAIPQISILIAGADGVIDKSEKTWAEKITQIRSYSFSEDLRSFYAEVSERYSDQIDELIEELPNDVEERTKILSERISKVEPILKKLQFDFACAVYKSYKSFAKHVAEVSGGFLDYGSINFDEYRLIDLPMIEFDTTNPGKHL